MHTKTQKESWVSCLLSYAAGSKGELAASIFLSIVSVAAGLVTD